MPLDTLKRKSGSVTLTFLLYFGLPLLAYHLGLACVLVDTMLHAHGAADRKWLWWFVALTELATAAYLALMAIAICAPSFMTLSEYFSVCARLCAAPVLSCLTDSGPSCGHRVAGCHASVLCPCAHWRQSAPAAATTRARVAPPATRYHALVIIPIGNHHAHRKRARLQIVASLPNNIGLAFSALRATQFALQLLWLISVFLLHPLDSAMPKFFGGLVVIGVHQVRACACLCALCDLQTCIVKFTVRAAAVSLSGWYVTLQSALHRVLGL